MTVKEVVVGIDVTASGRAALQWAADYARERNLRLRAIYVADPDVELPYVWGPGLGTIVRSDQELDADIKRADVTALFNVINPRLDWSLDIIQGKAPGRILVEDAQHAELLVVGTQDHTGVSRLFDGSVSHYCLSHAACPVVAIPAPVQENELATEKELASAGTVQA